LQASAERARCDFVDGVVTLAETHAALGIPADYGQSLELPRYEEALHLVDVEPNIVGRMQQLAPETAAAWNTMKSAAAEDSIGLLIVSGYRSIDYQTELFRKKLAAGITIEQILAVNAAPGFSQHHTGRAIDIATPGARPLTDEFETTPAFEWLSTHGARFGFRLPYGRGNRYGFCYEPWHWSQIGD
jgi:zinc D-Ala-D-Ala carboxypeptidase